MTSRSARRCPSASTPKVRHTLRPVARGCRAARAPPCPSSASPRAVRAPAFRTQSAGRRTAPVRARAGGHREARARARPPRPLLARPRRTHRGSVPARRRPCRRSARCRASIPRCDRAAQSSRAPAAPRGRSGAPTGRRARRRFPATRAHRGPRSRPLRRTCAPCAALRAGRGACRSVAGRTRPRPAAGGSPRSPRRPARALGSGARGCRGSRGSRRPWGLPVPRRGPARWDRAPPRRPGSARRHGRPSLAPMARRRPPRAPRRSPLRGFRPRGFLPRRSPKARGGPPPARALARRNRARA